MWNSIVKPALVLFIVCAVVAGSLAAVNALTKDTIEQNILIASEKARQEVLAEAKSFTELETEKLTEAQKEYMKLVRQVFVGDADGVTVGFVFNVANKGYGGDIYITVGVDTDGKITGVKIGDNNETPGLGTKANPEITNQLIGLTPIQPLTTVKVKTDKNEDIQAISGATITSRAVTDAVEAAVQMAQLLIKEGK